MNVLKVLIFAASVAVFSNSKPVLAEGEVAGQFDYFVLSLSWSPNWCALEGDDRGSLQCNDGSGHGWILHGLWPQFEDGWPSYCRTNERDPTRSQSAEISDIMGTSGSAWHQWKKHGRCLGEPASAFFDLSRTAYNSVVRPPVFRNIDRSLSIHARVIETAFVESNPEITRQGLTVTCKSGHISEVRICLNKDLTPRDCGPDVSRDCRLENAVLEGLR
jgi:ribonuclease T2